VVLVHGLHDLQVLSLGKPRGEVRELVDAIPDLLESKPTVRVLVKGQEDISERFKLLCGGFQVGNEGKDPALEG
jgi:uncharacterized protein (UPF0218 family)